LWPPSLRKEPYLLAGPQALTWLLRSAMAQSRSMLALKKQLKALRGRKLAVYKLIREARIELCELEVEEKKLERQVPQTLKLI
jgi:hypothetical protein